MMRLAVQKRVLGRNAEAMEMLGSAHSYLSAWKKCVSGHEGRPGTFCYSSDFRDLMRAQFDGADELLTELGRFTEEDLRDFSKAMEFSRKWNILQRTLLDTFFAHMAYYPEWLEMGGQPQAKRVNCADCHLFDAIVPPVPAFVALSALFMPRAASMPDGTPIPEGISLHQKASEFHEIHEHAHAYVHEKKSPGKRLGCEWIDEGIADWTAMSITQMEMKERSTFYEMYDFWLVIKSFTDDERKELLRAWCHAPDKFDWQRLVEDGLKALKGKREANRGAMWWKRGESCDAGIELAKYRK